jgi:hypothetical protein
VRAARDVLQSGLCQIVTIAARYGPA